LTVDGKTKIIEAARKIISESGTAAATTRAIAREAGMTTGTIYHYYRSKEDIMADVVDQNLSVSTRVAEKIQSQAYDYEEVITDLLEIARERFRKITDCRLQFYLAHESMMGNEELHKIYTRNYDDWVGRAEVIIDNIYGVPPTRLNRAIATWMIATVDGVILQMLLGTKMEDTDDLMKVWELLIREGVPAILKAIPPEI